MCSLYNVIIHVLVVICILHDVVVNLDSKPSHIVKDGKSVNKYL